MTESRPVVMGGGGWGVGQGYEGTGRRWQGLDPVTLLTEGVGVMSDYMCQNLSNYMLEDVQYIVCQLYIREV